MRGREGRRLHNNGAEKEMDEEWGGDKKETRWSKEEKKELWAPFYIPAPSPFSSNSKQLPLCAAVRELEVIASAFQRQAPVHSSGQFPANRQPRRKSCSPTRPQECISHWFVSRMTPPELTLPNISLFPFLLSTLSLFSHFPLSVLPPCLLLLFFFFPFMPSSTSSRGFSLFLFSVLQLVVLKSVACRAFGGRSRRRRRRGGGLWEPAQYP